MFLAARVIRRAILKSIGQRSLRSRSIQDEMRYNSPWTVFKFGGNVIDKKYDIQPYVVIKQRWKCIHIYWRMKVRKTSS